MSGRAVPARSRPVRERRGVVPVNPFVLVVVILIVAGIVFLANRR